MSSFQLFVAASLLSIAVHAQNTDIESLVDAERAFIQMAKEQSTRDAFMTFLADDGVTFGKEARIGKEYLKVQPANESWLFWKPVYSDIAASCDFGFNTGPWEFKAKRTDEKAVAYGQFVTVWTKVKGEWKAAIDIGIGHEAPKRDEAWKRSSMTLASGQNNTSTGKITRDIPAIENQFLTEKPVQSYVKYLSAEARIYRGGIEPLISPEEVQGFLKALNSEITFTPIAGQVASSADMAFVYGKSLTITQVDGAPKEIQSNYMRIWKKEGNSWKIVVDIVQ